MDWVSKDWESVPKVVSVKVQFLMTVCFPLLLLLLIIACPSSTGLTGSRSYPFIRETRQKRICVTLELDVH